MSKFALAYVHSSEQTTYVHIYVRTYIISSSRDPRRKFLSEFLEVGGILTVLEVLSVKKASEEDRMEALDLLLDIVKTGRQCKELLCESSGVRSVAQCLAQSTSTQTQDTAQQLLFHLFQVCMCVRMYAQCVKGVYIYIHTGQLAY